MYADDAGAWLVSHRDDMDRGEARWLSALARFDLDQGWYGDGQLSCVDWLMLHTKMGRATAFENLRVARQLHRRPLIAEAFAAGRLSYSAVRVITRIDDPDVDVDAALVDLAEAGTVADLERAVRFYQCYADQDRPPPDPSLRRQVQVVRHYDGTGEVHVTLTEVELEEFAAALLVFLDLQDRTRTGDQSAGGDSSDPARQWRRLRRSLHMETLRTRLRRGRRLRWGLHRETQRSELRFGLGRGGGRMRSWSRYGRFGARR